MDGEGHREGAGEEDAGVDGSENFLKSLVHLGLVLIDFLMYKNQGVCLLMDLIVLTL